MKTCRVAILAVVSFFFSDHVSAGDEKVIKIYLDSDRTNHIESALSMEMGIKAAFAEVDNMIQGYRVEFIPKDHKGNSVRSKLHMSEYLKDESALFILGGLHSPPYIKYRDYINEEGILTLVPWAAGGPITRHPSDENWIFRLSIDDTKAGLFMANYTVNTKKCQSPHLLLEKTAWGESNYKNMTTAIKNQLGRKPGVSWFNWNTKEDGARIKLRSIISDGDDCILFVGNSLEGAEFMVALSGLERKVPIISHWGITGGNFHKVITHDIRKKIDLSFIQSCFSFVSSEQTDISKRAFERTQALYPEVKTKKDIPAPTGFIHSYDLGRIVIAALDQIKLEDDIRSNRNNLRLALENVQKPVKGLIKEYSRPFSRYSLQNDDAHEALTLDDFCMGAYGADNKIIVFPSK